MAAATSAGELTEAMAEGNNAARLAGAGMDWYAAILATTIDATQMGATRVGNALTKRAFKILSNYAKVLRRITLWKIDNHQQRLNERTQIILRCNSLSLQYNQNKKCRRKSQV